MSERRGRHSGLPHTPNTRTRGCVPPHPACSVLLHLLGLLGRARGARRVRAFPFRSPETHPRLQAPGSAALRLPGGPGAGNAARCGAVRSARPEGVLGAGPPPAPPPSPGGWSCNFRGGGKWGGRRGVGRRVESSVDTRGAAHRGCPVIRSVAPHNHPLSPPPPNPFGNSFWERVSRRRPRAGPSPGRASG